uniref:Uncharacterized protein n=1 Tax=Zea mays TaxID=4577 RepID=C4J208_MAIZE|nr:unknown [Zea mays]
MLLRSRPLSYPGFLLGSRVHLALLAAEHVSALPQLIRQSKKSS